MEDDSRILSGPMPASRRSTTPIFDGPWPFCQSFTPISICPWPFRQFSTPTLICSLHLRSAHLELGASQQSKQDYTGGSDDDVSSTKLTGIHISARGRVETSSALTPERLVTSDRLPLCCLVIMQLYYGLAQLSMRMAPLPWSFCLSCPWGSALSPFSS